MHKSLLTASVLALAIAAPAAQAYQAGDFVVRAGAATVAPNDDSNELDVSPVGKIPGTKATVDDNTQLGLTFTYMLTDNLGLGVLGASPFKHTVSVKGVSSALGIPGLDGKLADIKHLPPTVSLQYFPLEPSSSVQPYVGAGLNYTTFFDENLSSEREAQGFDNLSLDDSWGLALEAGVDYMLSDNVLLNAAVWYVDIDTEATVDGPSALGATRTKVDVEIDPWVYMVGVGYKF